MSGKSPDPRLHHIAIITAHLNIGSVVLIYVAVSDSYRDTLGFCPTKHHTGKEGYVAMNSVVLSLPQDFPEATCKGPWIYSPRAWNHPTAELFHFAGKYSRFFSESAKVKFEAFPVNISQNIEKPGFNSSGIHRADNVKNFYRQAAPQSRRSRMICLPLQRQ
jgi:hypothetical protein